MTEKFCRIGKVEIQAAEIKRLHARFEEARDVVELLMARYDHDSLLMARYEAKTRGWVEGDENTRINVGCKDLVEMQTAEIKRLNARFEKARYVVKLLMATYDRDSLRVEYAEAKQWLDEESDD